MNQEIKSKSSASEEATPATNAEANGENTSSETETSAAAESNSETASDENKPSNATDSKPAESVPEKETTESTTSTGNQENQQNKKKGEVAELPRLLVFISYDTNDVHCTFHGLKADVFKTSVHIFSTRKILGVGFP